MGDVLNLRIARKAKARAESENRAAANRAKFGVSKYEKTRAESLAKAEMNRLDGHKRDMTEKP